MSVNVKRLAGKFALEETYELAMPLEFEGKVHEDITLRRVAVGDLRHVDLERIKQEQVEKLIVRLSGWPPEAVAALDMYDMNALAEMIGHFLRPSQLEIGTQPPPTSPT
ncbi:phage tail assembly protein [Bartonella sp. DGB2]|uniref:phage tail assembly protein n=1 Tax=Bartonella sp. DGB2 TaxID=3388426 RepID=UPI00398FEDFF